MSEGIFGSDDPADVTGRPPVSVMASADDWRLVELLRSGDEAAFVVC